MELSTLTNTLHIFRGIPGSGKSTLTNEMVALDPSIIVVSRDRIRMDFFGRERGVDEDFVTVIELAGIRAGLESGVDVISDSTNIRAKNVKAQANIAYELDANVEIVDFEISVEEAIRRNIARGAAGGRRVPDKAIRDMHSRYKKMTLTKPPTFEKYVPDYDLETCVLFDIDGTLAEMNGRGPFEWDKVDTDTVNEAIANMTDAFGDDIKIIVFSGRDGVSRTKTTLWLDDHNIHYDVLFMRDAGDMRPDTVVKMEMFDREIRNKYHCLGVFDDRPSVVRQWMKHGIPVFHVKPYAADF